MATKIFKPVSLLNDNRYDEFLLNINYMSLDDIKVCFEIIIEKYKDLKARFGINNERSLDGNPSHNNEYQKQLILQEKLVEQQERIKDLQESWSSEIRKNDDLQNKLNIETQKHKKLEETLQDQSQSKEDLEKKIGEIYCLKNSTDDQLSNQVAKCTRQHSQCSEEISKNQNYVQEIDGFKLQISETEGKVQQLTYDKSELENQQHISEKVNKELNDELGENKVKIRQQEILKNNYHSENMQQQTQQQQQSHSRSNSNAVDNETSYNEIQHKRLHEKVDNMERRYKITEVNFEELHRQLESEREEKNELQKQLNQYHLLEERGVQTTEDCFEIFENKIVEECTKKTRLHELLAEEMEKTKKLVQANEEQRLCILDLDKNIKYERHMITDQHENILLKDEKLDRISEELRTCLEKNQDLEAQLLSEENKCSELIKIHTEKYEDLEYKYNIESSNNAALEEKFNNEVKKSQIHEDRLNHTQNEQIYEAINNNNNRMNEDMIKNLEAEKRKNTNLMTILLNEQKQNNELIELYSNEQEKVSKMLNLQNETKASNINQHELNMLLKNDLESQNSKVHELKDQNLELKKAIETLENLLDKKSSSVKMNSSQDQRTCCDSRNPGYISRGVSPIKPLEEYTEEDQQKIMVEDFLTMKKSSDPTTQYRIQDLEDIIRSLTSSDSKNELEASLNHQNNALVTLNEDYRRLQEDQQIATEIRTNDDLIKENLKKDIADKDKTIFMLKNDYEQLAQNFKKTDETAQLFEKRIIELDFQKKELENILEKNQINQGELNSNQDILGEKMTGTEIQLIESQNEKEKFRALYDITKAELDQANDTNADQILQIEECAENEQIIRVIAEELKQKHTCEKIRFDQELAKYEEKLNWNDEKLITLEKQNQELKSNNEHHFQDQSLKNALEQLNDERKMNIELKRALVEEEDKFVKHKKILAIEEMNSQQLRQNLSEISKKYSNLQICLSNTPSKGYNTDKDFVINSKCNTSTASLKEEIRQSQPLPNQQFAFNQNSSKQKLFKKNLEKPKSPESKLLKFDEIEAGFRITKRVKERFKTESNQQNICEDINKDTSDIFGSRLGLKSHQEQGFFINRDELDKDQEFQRMETLRMTHEPTVSYTFTNSHVKKILSSRFEEQPQADLKLTGKRQFMDSTNIVKTSPKLYLSPYSTNTRADMSCLSQSQEINRNLFRTDRDLSRELSRSHSKLDKEFVLKNRDEYLSPIELKKKGEDSVSYNTSQGWVSKAIGEPKESLLDTQKDNYISKE